MRDELEAPGLWEASVSGEKGGKRAVQNLDTDPAD